MSGVLKRKCVGIILRSTHLGFRARVSGFVVLRVSGFDDLAFCGCFACKLQDV